MLQMLELHSQCKGYASSHLIVFPIVLASFFDPYQKGCLEDPRELNRCLESMSRESFKFPLLEWFARKYLTKPLTSATDERHFAGVARTATPGRASISPLSIEYRMIVRATLKRFGGIQYEREGSMHINPVLLDSDLEKKTQPAP